MQTLRAMTVAKAEAGRGRFRVFCSCQLIGEDLLLSIWGGTRAHIGSVAISQPRPSGLDPEKTSATSSVYNFHGHKDEAAARMFAERVSTALRRTTVAVAGIHLDGASPVEIELVIKNIDRLCVRLIGMLKKKTTTRPKA